MNKRIVSLASVFLLLVGCVYSWCYVLDTSIRRRMVANDVRHLIQTAKATPMDISAVDALLERARSGYNFEATYATAALGELGDAAKPRIIEIAELMQSDNSFVRREAARSLSKLGPRSTPALQILKDKVAGDTPSDDDTWFAAVALGEIGEPAVKCLPLLRSKLGTGAPQFDDCLRQAIEKLEKAKEDESALSRN